MSIIQTENKKKKIGWLNHPWALAFFAGLLSVLFMYRNNTQEVNHYTIMQLVPNVVWTICSYISLVICIVLFIRHIFFTKKELPSYDKIEKILILVLIVLFVITCFDRIVLGLASKAWIATTAEKRPSGFIETMIYMVINSSSIWLRGIQGTFVLSLLGTVFGFVLAILLVFMRIQEPNARDSENTQLLKLIGSTFAKAYITFVRGTPMMVQVFIIYYGGFNIVRAILPDASITEINNIYGFFTAGILTVTLNTTAYIAEILRGGIESIDKGQTEAARSLGLSSWQTMMKVVFPQAVKNSIPAIGNEFIINIKDTSVLNVIGVFELMYATSTTANTYYQYLPTYVIAAIIYLILTVALTKVLGIIGKMLDAPAQKPLPSSN